MTDRTKTESETVHVLVAISLFAVTNIACVALGYAFALLRVTL